MRDEESDEASGGKKVMLRGRVWHVPSFGRAAIIFRRFGKIVTFAGQDRLGRRSHAELTESGLVSCEATGENPPGERNTLHVCEILIDALRRAGDNWSDPVKGPDEPIDCECSNPDGEELRIQVVRATVQRSLWKRLTTKRSTGPQVHTPSTLAKELRASIETKRANLPAAVKANLVLALDATRASGYALDRVVDEFRSAHGTSCVDAGFRSVWLVGPFPEMAARLDVRAV